MWQFLTGSHGEALNHLQRAPTLTERTGDIPDQAHTHDTLASALEHQGDYRQALAHAVEALRLYQAIDNTTWQANALNTVGGTTPGSVTTGRPAMPASGRWPASEAR